MKMHEKFVDQKEKFDNKTFMIDEDEELIKITNDLISYSSDDFQY